MGQKLGAPHPSGEGAGSPSNTMSLGLRPTPCQVASWSIHHLATTDRGQKIGGGLRPFFGEGSWVPI